MMNRLRKRPWQLLLAMISTALVLATVICLIRVVVIARRTDAPKATAVLQQAAQGLDQIVIDAELDAQNRCMKVSQTMTLTSRVAQSRDEVVFRTWPNAFQKPDTSPVAGDESICPDGFSAGSLVVSSVSLERNGQVHSISHRYLDEAKTVLSLPLDTPWQPEETLQVTLQYTVYFPHIQYRFGWWEDTFMAGHAFATPALWQDGAYRTDAWLPIGDPLSGECANYQLHLTVPKGYACAGTGSMTGLTQSDDGRMQYTLEAPAVREMGLVISPILRKEARIVDGVLLQAYAPKVTDANRLLKVAEDALSCFSAAYGPYPYGTFTVCAAPMGVSGAEYPGMVMMADSLLSGDAKTLEYAVVHETAHQWWYALVGSDSSTYPWMDEALCEFSLLEYVGATYGKVAREELRQSRVESSMRVTVAGQATPGAPLDYFETNTDYMVLVYGRATSMLCAMDDWTGGKLHDALRQYTQNYAFAIATREDFTRLVNETTGLDMEPLMIDYLDTYLIN